MKRAPHSHAIVLAAIMTTFAAATWADTPLFGFAAVSCDHDDPSDAEIKTDYIDEVAGWTSANQVCISGDPQETADRLQRAVAHFTPVFFIEPVFFERSARRLRPSRNSEALWAYTKAIIADANVPVDELIFYVVDEPILFGLTNADVTAAVSRIHVDYPEARSLVIEAYLPDDPVTIPPLVDFWGFNTYTLADPRADAAFMAHLNDALGALAPHQSLAVIMDSQFTPIHRTAGLTRPQMADVARAYHALALSDPRIGLMLGYTWAGGIDGPWEEGLRQLPHSVIQTYQEIGRSLQQ